jgi:hypothetical protein
VTRRVFYALAVAFAVWMCVAVQTANGDPIPPPADESIPVPPSVFVTIPAEPFEVTLLLRRVKLEHKRYLHARRRVRQLTRTLQHTTSTREAIDLACVAYGASCTTMWRRARCESGGSPSPRARNSASGAAGLFQFLPSTWESTPYARFSVWSPYANALAAGWMETHGRGGEWVCR